MQFAINAFRALESWIERRSAVLNQPRAFLVASVAMPLLFGLLSLLMGQDDSWDLRNYHLYNVHALLNDRLAVDLAPARFQSYFNPTLDIPYYLLTNWFPGPVAGFVFGLVHGLNFVLVLAIARLLLDQLAPAYRYRVPVLLALAGAFSAGFLSELGNSMGDNLTALMVLWSLYIVLKQWDILQRWSGRAVLAAAGAGLAMGCGVGLKLTNVTYAVALCLAFVAMPLPFWQRVRLAFLFGVGVLAGIAVTAGWWMLKMWQMFGNPLFPQFNNFFHSPLAQERGVIDTYFLPKNVTEALLWPFVFTLDKVRVSEVPIKQAIWPVVYVLFIAFACHWLYRLLARRSQLQAQGQAGALNQRARFTLLFFALSYLAWMGLFSIYRYLIPVELLAPLVAWILLHRLLPEAGARRAAGYVLGAVLLYMFPFVTWGHMSWAERSFSAQAPAMDKPAASIVFIAQPHPPMAWLAQFFPPQAAFVAVGTGFPEAPAYRARIDAALAARPGPHYALLFASKNYKESSLQKKIAVAQWLGLTGSAAACARLDKMLQKVRFQVRVQPLAAATGQQCTLELLPKYQLDLPALDREIVATAKQHMVGYGLQLDDTSCKVYPAAVGAEPYPYQLCGVTPLPK